MQESSLSSEAVEEPTQYGRSNLPSSRKHGSGSSATDRRALHNVSNSFEVGRGLMIGSERVLLALADNQKAFCRPRAALGSCGWAMILLLYSQAYASALCGFWVQETNPQAA